MRDISAFNIGRFHRIAAVLSVFFVLDRLGGICRIEAGG